MTGQQIIQEALDAYDNLGGGTFEGEKGTFAVGYMVGYLKAQEDFDREKIKEQNEGHKTTDR